MNVHDEKKYEDVIRKLKGLRKVQAPANFESDLRRRINTESAQDEVVEKSLWGNILLPSKLIPSLGLGLAAAIVFMVININSEEMEDPFLIEPKIRKDIVEVVDYETTLRKEAGEMRKNESLLKDEKKQEIKKEDTKQEKVGLEKRSDNPKSGSNEGYVEEKKENLPLRNEVNPDISDKSLVESDRMKTLGTSLDSITEAPVVTETTSEVATGMAITKDELNFRQIQLNKEEQKVVDQLKMKVMSQEKSNKDVK